MRVQPVLRSLRGPDRFNCFKNGPGGSRIRGRARRDKKQIKMRQGGGEDTKITQFFTGRTSSQEILFLVHTKLYGFLT